MAAMPMAANTKSMGDATNEVVVLAFDLIGQQATNLPNLLQKSLSNKAVQDAIQSALDSFMLKRMTSGTSMNDLTPKDAQDLFKAITGAAGGKLGDAALNQIKQSPEYKQLQRALSDFEAAAKATPMGVWVDRHAGLVFVTGIALVIGGTAVLYATKTGGTLVNAVAGQIKGKPFKVFKIGKFTLQGQLLAFQPDKQVLGAGVVATEKWQKLQVSISLGVIAAGTSVQQVNGHLVLKTQGVNLGLTAADDLTKKKINLGLSLGFDEGSLKPLKVGVGLIMTDSGKVTGGTLDASLKTSAGTFGLKGQATGNEYQGLLTYGLNF
jgi:hypothetical protein